MASSQTKKPFNLHKWLRSRKGQQAIIIVLFMIVPVTLLLLFTYYPFTEMFKFSFYKMKYVGTRTFVGLKNYKEVFTRDDCFNSLKLAGYYIVASFIQLAMALYFATILFAQIMNAWNWPDSGIKREPASILHRNRLSFYAWITVFCKCLQSNRCLQPQKRLQ